MLSHIGYGYHLPSNEKPIHGHAVLYDSSSLVNNDDGIRLCWLKDFQLTRLQAGFWFILPWIRLDTCESQKRMLLVHHHQGGLKHQIDPWVTSTSSGIFEVIMLKQYSMSNVVNYSITGSIWINFDDVETIRTKISYDKQKKLHGCSVFQVINNDNWVLSRAVTTWNLHGLCLWLYLSSYKCPWIHISNPSTTFFSESIYLEMKEN